MPNLAEDARTILLPAISNLVLTDDLRRYFDMGGRTILIGEIRAECVGGGMTGARRTAETLQEFAAFAADIRRRAGSALLAVDQEPGGFRRLHELIPSFVTTTG